MKMSQKFWETVLVFIVLGTVLITCSGYVINIIDKATKSSAENRTRAMAATVEQIYIGTLLDGKGSLPFIAEFQNSEVYFRAGNPLKTFIYDDSAKIGGKLPESGTIKILKDGKLAIYDLHVLGFICNQELNKDLICKKA